MILRQHLVSRSQAITDWLDFVELQEMIVKHGVVEGFVVDVCDPELGSGEPEWSGHEISTWSLTKEICGSILQALSEVRQIKLLEARRMTQPREAAACIKSYFEVATTAFQRAEQLAELGEEIFFFSYPPLEPPLTAKVDEEAF